jgi:hypothetical protein
MLQSYRVPSILVLALLTSCTYKDKSTKLSSVHGAIDAEVVWQEKKEIGLGGAGRGNVGILWPTLEKETSCLVRLMKPPLLPPQNSGLRTGAHNLRECSQIQLVADDAQSRLAVSASKGFNVFYISPRGHTFETATPAPLNWNAVPSLRDVVLSYLRRILEDSQSYDFMADIHLRMVSETLGELATLNAADRIADVVMATRNGPYHWQDPWRAAFDTLPPEAQKNVHAALRADVETGVNVRAGALARAFVLHDFSDKRYRTILVSHANALIPQASSGSEDAMRTLATLLKYLAYTDLEAAVPLAYTFVSGVTPASFDRSLGHSGRAQGAFSLPADRVLAVALSVLRQKGKSCPNVNDLFEVFSKRNEGLCTAPAWFCANGKGSSAKSRVCAGLERAQRMPRLASESWTSLRGRLTSDVSSESLLDELVAARGLLEPLPSAMERAVSRQTYAWAQAPDGAPCTVRGSACESVELREKVCADAPFVLPVSGQSDELHFDDVKHTRWFEDPFRSKQARDASAGHDNVDEE